MVSKMLHISKLTFSVSYRREIEPFIFLTLITSTPHGCEFFLNATSTDTYLSCSGIIHFLVTFLSGHSWILSMVRLAFPVSTLYIHTNYLYSSSCLLMALFTMTHRVKTPTGYQLDTTIWRALLFLSTQC